MARNYALEYARRIARGLAKGLTRTEARGHAPVKHTGKGEQKQYHESWQRKSTETSMGLKTLMPHIAGEDDVLLIVSGCESCPSGEPSEEDEDCPGGVYGTRSNWVQTSVLENASRTRIPMIDLANDLVPVQCWEGQTGTWIKVDRIAVAKRNT